MANVLLVDPDKVAQTAMKGILVRSDHGFSAVDTATEAWEFIRRNVTVDLLVIELKLKEERGLDFIQRLKSDLHLKAVPVVVYTAHGDRDSVKNVLSLQVQNFLLKPYRDEALFAEINKASSRPWRQQHFAKEEAVCKRTGLTPDTLRAELANLRESVEGSILSLKSLRDAHEAPLITDELKRIAASAVRTGAVGVLVCLRDLNDKAVAQDWTGFDAGIEQLEFAAKVITYHLDPSFVPEDFLIPEELDSDSEEHARAFWEDAVAEDRCPLLDWDQLQKKVSALTSCPVVESIAASFQMSANGHPTSLSPLLDLVQKDPSLTAQILIASNRLKKGKGDGDGGAATIEEPRIAIGLLGELRLASLGGSLLKLNDRLLLAPPHFSWPTFRMFQLGTARLAQFVCRYLELSSLEAAAYTAGLLHDLGKILLVQLYPYALPAILEYALQNGVDVSKAEKLFLGATTHQMAAQFAEKQGLPKRFANVLRWIDDPEEATDDAELVAVVSLARRLCRHNRLGFSGNPPEADSIPLENSAEWKILRSRVFLNFDLKKFERLAHRECLNIKRELQGQLANETLS